MKDNDLSTPDNARKVLAKITSQFIATPAGERDVQAFRAIVQALETILGDYARLSRDKLEGDIEALSRRLALWEKEQGNAE